VEGVFSSVGGGLVGRAWRLRHLEVRGGMRDSVKARSRAKCDTRARRWGREKGFQRVKNTLRNYRRRRWLVRGAALVRRYSAGRNQKGQQGEKL